MSEVPTSPAAALHTHYPKTQSRAPFAIAAAVLVQLIAAPIASLAYTEFCGGGSALICLRSESRAEGRRLADADQLRQQLYACNRFDARACTIAADLLMEERDGAATPDVIQALRRGCALKSGAACSRLGRLRQAGEGVERDLTIAGRLYRRACELGAANACGNLAMLHERGHGVVRDELRAYDLYMRACDLGLPRGCSDMLRMEARD